MSIVINNEEFKIFFLKKLKLIKSLNKLYENNPDTIIKKVIKLEREQISNISKGDLIQKLKFNDVSVSKNNFILFKKKLRKFL